jgi:glycine betaine/proline transport system ATP-binding protein
MHADRTVRDAAREALASPHPVRVVDGDQLVGVVDDDDLLRVIVAEEVPTS